MRVRNFGRLWCSALLIGLGACEELREIGSQCLNGLCEVNAVPSGPACIVQPETRKLYVDRDSGLLAGALACDKPWLARDETGLVPCNMFWRADDPAVVPDVLRHCAGFLTPGGTSDDGSPRCQMRQIALPDGGTPSDMEQGFYLLDHVSEDTGLCPDGQQPGAFRYTSAVRTPPGVRAEISCTVAHKQGSDGRLELSDPLECAGAKAVSLNTAIVGAACMPELSPQAGYDVNEVWIETGRRECGAAACLVSHVPGLFSGDCAPIPGQFNDSRPPCADLDPDEVYCSCRCGVADGVQAPTCACPRGFTCGLIASQGPFAGSYCLRDATF